ncbi:hypothetical protein BDW42DRAFT_107391 [Aspergillus taichungensis]|uniref:Uncharacterized protein n=1 Tax=Aspergillus taichungensis TaxID=482145 RepID=A0A2J5HU91_9EURO|nr:hypothetical protein BDW42DRAFT_107391 [Aspergillus taichungensis]
MSLFHTLHKKKSTPESTCHSSSSSRPDSISEMTLVEQKTRQKKEQREKRLYPQEFNAGDMCFGSCCRK